MKIQEVAVNKLIPYAKNSRTHSPEQVGQIAASIKEFGFRNPILVDGVSVIAGHGRLLAAQKLKLDKVPTLDCSDMTPSQKKAYIIADNKIALNAGWDNAMLTIELQDLEDEGFDLTLTGFDDKELDALLNVIEGTDGLTDEDAIPDTPIEPKTKLGDIYILGNHRLMCGNSSDINTLDKLLKGCIPNAIVTDPPYGIGIDGQKKSVSTNPKHNRKHHEFRGWDSERPDEGIFNYIVALNVPTVIWGGNYFADLLPATRGWLYWSKGQDGLTMSDGELAWTTENKPLRSKTVNRNALKGSVHPTQKPVDVIDFSIDYLKVPQKGSVLDLFGGSGTTLICCEKSDKKAYLMELDPKYCDVIVKRWEDFTGKKAVLSEL